MPSKTQVVYQPYVAGPRGSLKAGVDVACRSAEEGLRPAELAMAGGSILGAQVVEMGPDDDAGEFGEPTYLGQFGRVPDGE